MLWFRVTKYDPRLRTGPGGAYARDEWTAMSDIGREFNGNTLSLEQYLDMESSYLNTARLFAADAECESMVVRGLEWHGTGPASHTEGQVVPLTDAMLVVREMLREGPLWCRLEDDDRFIIHIGSDYYMYIGTRLVTDTTLGQARDMGLFVESNFRSPYRDDS